MTRDSFRTYTPVCKVGFCTARRGCILRTRPSMPACKYCAKHCLDFHG